MEFLRLGTGDYGEGFQSVYAESGRIVVQQSFDEGKFLIISRLFFAHEDGGTVSSETFALKNGGVLILRHAVETEENGSQTLYTQVWLQSAAERSLIVDHEDAITFFRGAEKYLFRYEGIDFDDYFCLTVYDGDTALMFATEYKSTDVADALVIRIHDNGRGFREEASGDGRGHWGLVSMRERVALLGGRLEILSEGGTTVAIRIENPLP